MPRPSSRSSSAWLLALAVALAPAGARAQACCAGSSVLTPARLGIHEDAAVGAIVRATGYLGSWQCPPGDDLAVRCDVWTPNPRGTGELDGELDLVGTLRLLGDLQLTLLVPAQLIWRAETGGSVVGGWLGDLNLSARYDLFHAGQSRLWPGVAVLAGVTFPTGHGPETTVPTGTGAFQLTGGVALEQSFGPWLVNLTGLVAWRSPRGAQGVTTTLGVQLQALAGVGYVFPGEESLAASLGYLGELDAVVNGATAPRSARGLPTVGLSGSLPLGETWRLQGGLTYNPGVAGLGLNQPGGLGISLSVLKVWL